MERRLLRVALGGLVACGLLFLGLFAWRASTLGLDALHLRKWCTLLASLGLITGAIAGLRGRTWGLLLVLLATSSMLGAVLVGIAGWPFLPPIALGGLALGSSVRGLWRADRAGATALLALALALGGAAAAIAGPLFEPVMTGMGALERRIDEARDAPREPAMTTGHDGELWSEGYHASDLPYGKASARPVIFF